MLPIFTHALNLVKKPSSLSYLCCVFDATGISLVLFEDKVPVKWCLEKLPQGVVSSGRILDKSQFTQAFKICYEKCMELTTKHTRSIYFGVDNGNCFNAYATVRQTRDTLNPITKKDLTLLYKEAERNTQDDVFEQVYEITGNPDLQLVSSFSETSDIRLDGIVNPNPEGASCKLLELSLYTVFCEPSYIDTLEDVSADSALDYKGVIPIDYAVSAHLKLRISDTHNSVLLVVRKDYTNVSVVFGGQLIQKRILPLGSDSFDGNLELWLYSLELLFKEFTGIKTFSSDVYLVGVGMERTDFWEMLEWYEWEKQVPFKAKPVFTKLDPGMFDFPQELKGNLLISAFLGICKE